MINFCLDNKDIFLLKGLIEKKLIKYRHDPLDKFGQEIIYGRVELFFEDSIVMVCYEYAPFPLFGSQDDEHPKFFIKKISEEEATSALQDVVQIDIRCNQVVSDISLVEDYIDIEWDGKKDSFQVLKAIIIKLEKHEIAFQGDHMIPLLEIIKGLNVTAQLTKPGDEFKNDPEVMTDAKRFINGLSLD